MDDRQGATFLEGCLQNRTSSLGFAGEWVHKGPKVHGRKYKRVEERQGEWVALISDQQWDTLNAELLLLENTTQAMRPGAAASTFDGNATAKV